MAGELVQVVMVPRYTTYCGAADYVTIAMDVTRYSYLRLVAWRGPMLGVTPIMAAAVEGSTDGFTWAVLVTQNLSAAGTEYLLNTPTDVRWVRVRVTLGGTDPAATCWITGSLELRVA